MPLTWHAALAVLALGAVASAAVSVVGSRRSADIRTAAAAGRSVVAEARAAGAMTWAAEELRTAETTFNKALADQRIQETRVWPLPDSASVIALYNQAERHAADASRLAAERRSSAEAASTALVADARAAVEASDTLARTIHLGTERRVLLARAHSALVEAAVYGREGDFGTATVRARQAIDLAAQVRDQAAAVAARYADAETVARWRRWHAETIAWSRREGRPAIIVAKEAHTLTLYVGGVAVRTYRVDLGFNWIADKLHAGDGATPEGRYRVVARKANGASIYYKALLLDYPNKEDRAEFSQARRSGAVPSTATIGGLIEIHGEGGRGRDWTKGCVALTNAEIDELFARVAVGTPVTIVGSDNDGAIGELGGQRRGSQPEPRL